MTIPNITCPLVTPDMRSGLPLIEFPTEPGIYYPNRRVIDRQYSFLFWHPEKHLILLGDKAYELNLADLREQIPKENKLDRLFEQYVRNYYMPLCTVYGSTYHNKNRLQELAVFRVAEGTVDVSDEAILLTDKTIDTFYDLISKEIKNFHTGINPDEWVDLYKSNRLTLILKKDGWPEVWEKQGYITYRNIFTHKLDARGERYPAFFRQIAGNWGNLFEEHEVEFAKFWLAHWKNYQPISLKTLINSNIEERETVVKAAELAYSYDIFVKEAVRSNNIRGYSIGNEHHRAYDSVENYLNTNDRNAEYRLYKLAIIYPANLSKTAEIKLMSEYERSLAGFPSREVVRDVAYQIRTSSLSRSKKVEDYLTKYGWLVINLTAFWRGVPAKDKD